VTFYVFLNGFTRFLELWLVQRAEFTGRTCETHLELCKVNICENGATCFLSLDGSAQCACADGYDGPTCGHRVRWYRNCSWIERLLR